MFLNVGGAVLGVAILTAISDSVASKSSGDASQARLDGYRAGYYGAIAMAAIGLAISFFLNPLEAERPHEESPREEEPLPAKETNNPRRD